MSTDLLYVSSIVKVLSALLAMAALPCSAGELPHHTSATLYCLSNNQCLHNVVVSTVVVGTVRSAAQPKACTQSCTPL